MVSASSYSSESVAVAVPLSPTSAVTCSSWTTSTVTSSEIVSLGIDR